MATTSRRIEDDRLERNHNFKQSDLVSKEGKEKFIVLCTGNVQNGKFSGMVIHNETPHGRTVIGHPCKSLPAINFKIYPDGIMLKTEKRKK